MKKTTFYPNIWQVIPYSFDSYQWDSTGRPVKDLVLKNWYSSHAGVSEMALNITRFSALDIHGEEHFIEDFKGMGPIPIKGLHKGEFIRSRSILMLETGTYTTLRFYLADSGNSFVYSDGRKEEARNFQYLNFEIENGLTIQGNEAPEVILRFDLEPFKPYSIFKTIGKIFKWTPHSSGTLTKSIGH